MNYSRKPEARYYCVRVEKRQVEWRGNCEIFNMKGSEEMVASLVSLVIRVKGV